MKATDIGHAETIKVDREELIDLIDAGERVSWRWGTEEMFVVPKGGRMWLTDYLRFQPEEDLEEGELFRLRAAKGVIKTVTEWEVIE